MARVSLEQWRTLLAVVDEGGYAQAAEWLGKSQSSVSYAIQKLEGELGVRLFAIEGRKAVLTPAGEQLCLRARRLLEEAVRIEQVAQTLTGQGLSEVSVAMEAIFPDWLMLAILARFGEDYPLVRAQLRETVLGGTDEAILERKVDLAISSRVPTGFLGDALMRVRFVAVASPQHPLHQQGETAISWHQLRQYRQLVVRDTGLKYKREAGAWLEAEQRWTVSHIRTAIRAVCMGAGFGWYPEWLIRDELQQGMLKPLPLKEGRERFAELYLIYTDAELASPAVKALGQAVKEAVQALPAPPLG